jgi:hypothetical protein
MRTNYEQQLATMPVGCERAGIRAGDKVPFVRTGAACAGDVVLCSILGEWRIVTVRRKFRNGYSIWEPGARAERLVAAADGFVIHGVILSVALDVDAQPFYWKVRGDAMEPEIRRGELVRIDPRRRFEHLVNGEVVLVRLEPSNLEAIGRLRLGERGAWLERLNAPPLVLGRRRFTILGAWRVPTGTLRR